MASNSTSCALSEEVLEFPESRPEADLLDGNDITTWERVKICFKPTYKMKKLKNKGGVLVLVLNFLVVTVFYYISYKFHAPESVCPLCFQLIGVPIGLVLPFMGWLADVYIGRYKALLGSIMVMWISALLLTATFAAEKIMSFQNYYQLVPLVSMGFGYGCFQASIIQFGIDQLTDASTNEIISFIHWYVWTYISSGIVANFASKCSSPHDKYIAPLLLSVSLSAVLILLFLGNSVIIKEPVTQNPFKLIYRVVKYAIKHRFPQQRSAFTYCEDDVPSRMDFGKTKYGGPFTTEQVEDVKTFFGVLGWALVVGSVFSITNEDDFHSMIVGKTMADQVDTYQFGKCSYMFLFTDIFYITVAILIPLNECLIDPIFHRCLPNIRHYQKIGFGMVLHVGRYIALSTLVTLSRQHYMTTEAPSNNMTYPCIFQDNFLPFSTTPYDYRYYTIPEVISAISLMMILVGVIELMCAQVPYSMKGVIVGIFYASLVLFFVLDKGIIKTFHTVSPRFNTKTLFSCGFWYLQIKTIFLLIAVLSFFCLLIVYKKRKREDVLPNEQIFAERYYSKKLQCT